jgi:hypothetical protein
MFVEHAFVFVPAQTIVGDHLHTLLFGRPDHGKADRAAGRQLAANRAVDSARLGKRERTGCFLGLSWFLDRCQIDEPSSRDVSPLENKRVELGATVNAAHFLEGEEWNEGHAHDHHNGQNSGRRSTT